MALCFDLLGGEPSMLLKMVNEASSALTSMLAHRGELIRDKAADAVLAAVIKGGADAVMPIVESIDGKYKTLKDRILSFVSINDEILG